MTSTNGDKHESADDTETPVNGGMILIAAFVDPAYADAGDNATIELKASSFLLGDENAIREPEVPTIPVKKIYKTETEQVIESRCGIFNCCRKTVSVDTHTYFVGAKPVNKREADRVAKDYVAKRDEARRQMKEREMKERDKRKLQSNNVSYDKVPEGILVYRLDTSDGSVTLLSRPHRLTDIKNLLRFMTVEDAEPSPDKSRRGILLTGKNGVEHKLTACEQRTAVAWMEALNMMLRRKHPTSTLSSWWGNTIQSGHDGERMEELYLNLAAYSNNLIRTGTLGKKDKKESITSLYYAIYKSRNPTDENDDETLESIAKRRAIIKDSWDFYRMVCSLLRDRRKYNETFRRLQQDPVYAYVNSLTGLNDPGDDGLSSDEKLLVQRDLREYEKKSRTEVCRALIKAAESTLPSLIEICKALAGSLGVEEVGVGPIKDITSALRKAERKYHGDVLKVTDFCRALLVVKDLPTLLALLELMRDSFGPLIRRVKLSYLKANHKPLPGGYRDCKINVELDDHICEIQVHLLPMWEICGVKGFRHYRHCLEYNTDTFTDPYDALAGLDRRTLADLVLIAEETVSNMPISIVESSHEKYILDYFAEIGLFINLNQLVWAETTLRHLILLRSSSPDIGPDHEETLYLQKYLERVVRDSGRSDEANEIYNKIKNYENLKKKENGESTSLWEAIVDPIKNARAEDDRIRKEVKQSKKAWRKMRAERFDYLNTSMDEASARS